MTPQKEIEWYKKNTGKSPDCPHYINSDPKYNPDGWKYCTQCVANASPTSNDCNKCGNPSTMYWCSECEENSEYSMCLKKHGCIIDNDYHLNCN